MKKIVSLCALLLISISLSGQNIQPWDETKEQVYQRQMNFDYSVPDYKVARPDAATMGWRLAKTLQALNKNYTQTLYNNLLAQILNEQMGEVRQRFVEINKLKVVSIEKKDSTISIIVNVRAETEGDRKISQDLYFVFVHSLSASENANILFSDLARYIRKEDSNILFILNLLCLNVYYSLSSSSPSL